MGQQSRANRVALRRAVWASVALHAVAACALLLFVRTGEQRVAAPGIDTRAPADPQVRMSLAEVAVSVEPPSAPPAPSEPPAAQPPAAQPAPLQPEKVPPLAVRAPQTLPSEMLAVVRRSAPRPVEGSGAPNAPPVDPNVKPAGASGTGGAAAPAIHGALDPNQTAVYVLDCSGSMGAAGKFDAARAALVSTLKQQPTSVRFQVVVYSGTAVPLLAGNGTAVVATEANVRAAAERLAKLDARGKSNHLEAVRAALAFRPDVILLLTDADDLDAAALKSICASGPKVVLVCVGQVTAEGVQRPRELK